MIHFWKVIRYELFIFYTESFLEGFPPIQATQLILQSAKLNNLYYSLIVWVPKNSGRYSFLVK